MTQIEAVFLTKKFGRHTSIEDFCFSVGGGEIFGLLGHNGSGKTTTLQILATLLKPSGGTAVLNGYDILKEPARVRRSIGVVFQEPCLDRRLNVRENLEFYAGISLNRSISSLAGRIDEALKLAGLSESAGALVSTLSGGQRRRLEIARSLISRPQVLLLDEPTLSLDLQSKQSIWEHIRRYRDRGGNTVVLATNDMAEAEICDRLAIMNEGRIMAVDSLGNLKEKHGGLDEMVIHTGVPDEALRILREKLGLEGTVKKDALSITMRDAFHLLPAVIEALSSRVTGLEISRPTISQVYLKLTGKQLSEVRRAGERRRQKGENREIIRI
jgi:ABC-2 type transport system ATP-binding protein